jgi:hypothetical protein
MSKDAEKRWKREDNPLFFLAFALHPSFRKIAVAMLDGSKTLKGNWQDDRNPLSVARLVAAAKFYYGKYRLFRATTVQGKQEELVRLGKKTKQWLQGKVLDDLSIFEAGENAAEWHIENQDEWMEPCNLGAFLMDAAMHGAGIERYFKDWARYHTKTRNRTEDTRVYAQTVIKHEMRRKYPEDRMAGKGTYTKNRIVSADKYMRVDVPQSPGQQHANDLHIEEEKEEAEEEAEEEEEEQEESMLEEGMTELDHWLRVLHSIIPEGEEAFFDNSEDSDDAEDENEDPFQVQPVPLPPLPNENVADYPQEDARYFRNKNYVRKDKYSLATLIEAMCEGGVELPTLLSIYKL